MTARVDAAFAAITARAARAEGRYESVSPARERSALPEDLPSDTGVVCDACGGEATVLFFVGSGEGRPLCSRDFGRARDRRRIVGGRYVFRLIEGETNG